MDDLSATNRHEGPFLLLEDDNWVAPDTLHVLDLLLNTTNSQQGLFTLGNHKRSLNFGRMSSTFSIQVWRSTVHNIGMVVTRRFWRFMKQNAYCFCRYDDYNWGEKLVKHFFKKLSLLFKINKQN